MSSYRADREWSDRWISPIKRIVGPYLLFESSFEEDTKQAADLIVLRARFMSIACRVRRSGFAEKYPNQFTIRYKRDNGQKTELHKIIDGWGDWFFYGHELGDEIFPWMLISLAAFRAGLLKGKKQIKYAKMPNGDGTHFIWFDATSFPEDPPLLIASSDGHVQHPAPIEPDLRYTETDFQF